MNLEGRVLRLEFGLWGWRLGVQVEGNYRRKEDILGGHYLDVAAESRSLSVVKPQTATAQPVSTLWQVV